MASQKSLRQLNQSLINPLVTSVVPASGSIDRPGIRAGSGNPYESSGTGRRMAGWNPTRLGATTNLWSTLDMMQSRSRDAVRNNPWASSAIDTFEAQGIGTGIRPHWNVDDQAAKAKIETEFRKWAMGIDLGTGQSNCSTDGMLNFYGMQALVGREVFEAGEVLVRQYSRPSSWKLRVPYQLQLIESEQMPVWRTSVTGGDGIAPIPKGNVVRTGIEFDPSGRRIAYHMYREHPGDTMLFPLDTLQWMRVPAQDIRHVYKPLRAGQLRGQPMMAPVLTSLREIDDYTDAAIVKKKIQTMFAGIIEKIDPNAEVVPIDRNQGDNGTGIPTPYNYDPLTASTIIEPGTFQYLFPGEKVTFPTLPSEQDFEMFMVIQLHKVAIGMGLTYEQLTGDLKGVNYSSIRAGLLDFRRKCEQWQRNIIIQQFCYPVVCRWLLEAYLAGTLALPGFAADPSKYLDITWSPPAWNWVDPLKDTKAAEMQVRDGFASRQQIVAELGEDVNAVDQQQQQDKQRADSLGLKYDIDPTYIVLVGTQAKSQAALNAPAVQADAQSKQVDNQKKQIDRQGAGGSGGDGGDGGSGGGSGSPKSQNGSGKANGKGKAGANGRGAQRYTFGRPAPAYAGVVNDDGEVETAGAGADESED